MAPQGSVWDHKADKDLLLVIIGEGQLKGINWSTVSEKLQAKNYTFTKEACRQHFQKIRRESDGGASPLGRNTDPKPPKITKSTPRGKGKSMPNNSTPTGPANSFGYGTASSDANDDEEEQTFTPSKRKRAKVEVDEDYGRGKVFKVENGQGIKGAPIDLDDDQDLYDGQDTYNPHAYDEEGAYI